MTGLDNEFQKAVDEARTIAATKENITYPSMQSAHHIRHVMKQILYIMDQRTAQDAVPYMPTMDEVHRFMVSNPSTSAEMLFDIQKPKRA
jgi:hypothetical protein